MKKILLLLVAATIVLPIWSKPIDENTAHGVAVQILSHPSTMRSSVDATQQKQKTLQLLYKSSSNNNNENANTVMRAQQVIANETVYFYVFGTEDNKSFVMVSGDDRVAPVLGYSYTNGFSTDNMPDNLKWWLGEYAKQIQYAIENNIEPTPEIEQQWANVEKGEFVVGAATSVEPLVKTKWDQCPPFNNKCPIYNGTDRAATGCVATAMAQIMNFWKYPISRTATIPAYTTRTYGISIPALEGTTYDWYNMLDNYLGSGSNTSAQENAVSTLIYHCGAAVNMDYGPSSAASSSSVVSALIAYFGYDGTLLRRQRDGYNDTDWHAILRTELDAGHPIYYSGSPEPGSDGHAWICDGYNGDYFHMNWGWWGANDDYYLTSAALGYNSDQEIIINIKPNEGWQIGYPNAADVIARLDNGTLTINGRGAMQDWDITLRPWERVVNNVTSVVINNGITTIGNRAFGGCNNITSVTIPNSITAIGDGAFAVCSSLTSVIIPNSVISIGNNAFAFCSSLASVTIPNSVTTIGSGAFGDLSNLTDVTVNWVTPLSVDGSIFRVLSGITLSNVNLHVPAGTQCAYAATPVWQDFNIVGGQLTITASAGSNGSISPNGTTNLNCGGSQTFTFTPNAGYGINQVLVDGTNNAEAVSSGSYTFSNVTTNHTINVTFKPIQYTLTVNGGTGSGSYSAGVTVNITAGTPPAGQQFKNWTTSSAGVTFANANASSTSFTMPANAVTVTANYEAIPIVNAQTPTITTQLQSATVNVGVSVTLSVTASVTDGGTLSYQWYKESAAISGATGNTYSPSTATVGTTNYYVIVTNTNNSVTGTKTATVQSSTVTVTVTPAPVTKYTLTVNNGTGGGNYAAGETVNITAGTPPAGQQFKNWTASSAEVTFADANASSTSFTMPANAVTVTANFEAIPIVNAQTPTIITQLQSTTVNVGVSVTLSVTASVTDGGTLSYQWYKESAAISGATGNTYSPSTATVGTTNYYVIVTNTNNSVNGTKTATVQSSTATVTVTTAQVTQYTLTVNNGSGSGSYTTGTAVNIIANTAPSDKIFDKWTGDIAGIADVNAASTTYTMGSTAATITATYKDLPKYTITALAESNGMILPSGDISVNQGSSQTFNFYPDNGYEINQVLVDGSNVGTVNSYTFSNVSANHTISVSFKLKISWEIGSPIAANVIATFNNGTLTISGTGDMQGWNNTSMPWYNVKNSITSVVINYGVTTIGTCAFEAHTNLSSVSIPSSITSTGSWAFVGCTKLTSITLPASITSISQESFRDCSNLAEIHCENPNPPSVGYASFDGVNKATCILYVPFGTISAYKAAYGWKDFFNIYTAIEQIEVTNIKIYPNPVKNELVIERDNLNVKNEKVQIIDFSGRIIINSQFSPLNLQLKINVSHLSAGTYIVKIGSYTSKFVKK